MISRKKWVQATLHTVIWIMVFALPYVLDSGPRPGNYVISTREETAFFYLRFSTYFMWIPVFYLNSEILTPRLIYRKRIISYALLLLLILTVILVFHGLIFNALIPDSYSLPRAIRYNLPTFMLTVAVSVLYKMSRDRVREEETIQEIQQENLRTELSFLRSQISPHFVFNVLNNIVAMVRLKHENLEETVIKLSSLMQYMLYEADDEKVRLKREAEYLQSYIDLQQQRFGSKVKISTKVSLSDDWHEIEPMLLIPFVENAFKHGVGMISDPQILVDLRTEDRVLYFSVRNKFNHDQLEIKDKTSGIGLNNVTRRLNLLYAGEHKLEISTEGNWFNVSLQLNLHA